MDGIMPQERNVPTVLEGYAQQGRMFLFNAAQNLIQFGRVLTEAKPFVPHGQFVTWVKDNFDISKSTAENYMNVWKRFGNSDALANVQYSKLRAMLSLPEGAEEAFTDENDLETMTAAAVQEAVERVRQEEKEKFDAEHKARENAERALKDLENADPVIPQEFLDDLADKNQEITRLTTVAQDAVESSTRINSELTRVRRELDDATLMLQEQQESYNSIQTELLKMQSAKAKGDVDRQISERLTCDDFTAAVRQFLGIVAQMPFMGSSFAVMQNDEIRQFDELLKAVESWANGSRKAIDTIQGEVYDCE